MKLTIEAVDFQSLKFQIYELSQSLGFPSSVPAQELEPALASPEPPKEPRKRAKKILPPAEELALTPAEEIEPISPPAASNLKEQVFSALKKVSTNKGMTTAKELLTKFNCARISELKEDQFPEFIKACEALAA